MPARQSASLLLKFGVAALFLCGIGFGAVAALSQPDVKAKPVPEVAKAEASKPTAAPTPEPKLEPKVESKTPEVKPEPKKTEPPKPEVKKPEPEPKKPEPKPEPEPPKSSPVTFQRVQKVLKDNCTMCHGDPLIKAKIDLRTLDAIKKKDGLVVPGDPAASDMWGSIEGGTMPPPDAKTKLTDAEKKIIQDWIAGGAK